MCVIMMVFSVCVNDIVYRLYMLVFKAELWLIMTFSSPPAFGGYQFITKVKNRFQYFSTLLY